MIRVRSSWPKLLPVTASTMYGARKKLVSE
jgi:hypothetical protein